jgi:hypothetical protein
MGSRFWRLLPTYVEGPSLFDVNVVHEARPNRGPPLPGQDFGENSLNIYMRSIQKGEKWERMKDLCWLGNSSPIDPEVLAAPERNNLFPFRDQIAWFNGSTREADTAHKVLKARVRAESIEARPQQDARVKSLFVGYFKPIHGLISIP